VKNTGRLSRKKLFEVLASRLADAVVDTAAVEQDTRGRGVLCVRFDPKSVTWTYKPEAECADEVREWSELESLLSSYNPSSEVLILLPDGGDCFRLSI
jgi:hypothetical protein